MLSRRRANVDQKVVTMLKKIWSLTDVLYVHNPPSLFTYNLLVTQRILRQIRKQLHVHIIDFATFICKQENIVFIPNNNFNNIDLICSFMTLDLNAVSETKQNISRNATHKFRSFISYLQLVSNSSFTTGAFDQYTTT